SQLLQHSNGKLYWIGHITQANARGNRPRYPVMLGEVDASGLLIRDTVIPIDDRRVDDDEILMIYPIYAREDRRTGEIAVHMSRVFAFAQGWKGDALLYRIAVSFARKRSRYTSLMQPSQEVINQWSASAPFWEKHRELIRQ